MANTLWFGDNLHILREHIPSNSVDLVYLDPPFKSDQSYNVLFKSPVGAASPAQVHAFEDTWRWGGEAELALDDIAGSSSDTFRLLAAMRDYLGHSDVMAYLVMMAVRLIELRRVMKSAGSSIYLHCDLTASHYLKILLDGIFGAESYAGEIVWKRTNARGTTENWPRLHDLLLYYRIGAPTFHAARTKGDPGKLPHTLVTGADGRKYQTFELTAPGRTRDGESGRPWRGFDPGDYGRHWANRVAAMEAWDATGQIHWPKNGGWPRRLADRPFDPDSRMVTVGDVWCDIDRLNQTAKERLGYPTQKPLALMERVIHASTNPGDVVLDPFCGCGTTVHAAQLLGRHWTGIDITHVAIQIIEDRFRHRLPTAKFSVRGIPRDEPGARALARRDPYQFQLWAVSRLNGQPRGRGADRGVDGEIFYKTGARSYGRAIISVKSGQIVNPGMVRDLVGTVQLHGADMGVFVCLDEPTQEMKIAASAAGIVQLPGGRRPRVQIVTVKDLVGRADVGLTVTLNTIAAAAAAKAKPKPPPAPKPREPQMLMPMTGGKARKAADAAPPAEPQPSLPIATPLLRKPKRPDPRQPSFMLPVAGGSSVREAAEDQAEYRGPRPNKRKSGKAG